MALLIMCCFDTEANKRTEYTKRTIQSLLHTVDFNKNRIIVVDNASCLETKEFLKGIESKYGPDIKVITLTENVGTARGVNEALKERTPNQLCIKLDNDIEIHRVGWVEEMKECFIKRPDIGVLGLKRPDLGQSPTAEGFYKTSLEFLPHTNKDRWIVIERSADVIGTCTMINPKLLDKIGGFHQISEYGFDDAIICKKSLLCGFKNYFLPTIPIDHLDRADTEYIEEKKQIADRDWNAFVKLGQGLSNGSIPLFYNRGAE